LSGKQGKQGNGGGGNQPPTQGSKGHGRILSEGER
jgi:hypothetical protein